MGNNNTNFYVDTKNKEYEELKLDFNFEHLIISNDDEIDKKK